MDLISRNHPKEVLTPEGVHVRNPSPYFTYEVGTDEAPHPDQAVAERFVELVVSDCPYGCKIYADPYSEIRVLMHSEIYGCRRTVAEINKESDIRPGDTVAFVDLQDPLVTHRGRVLNYLPPDEHGFQGGYHVGTYYIVTPDRIFDATKGETYQQVYERLTREGIFSEEQVAEHLGVTVEKLRGLRLRTERSLIFDGTEFKVGDIVSFYDFEDPTVKHLGTISRYISPDYAPEDHPHGGYGVTYRDGGRFRHILFYQKNKLKKE